MAEQSKRKGKRAVGSRVFLEEDKVQNESGKLLTNLFESFMRSKELEGLRPRTLTEHRSTFKYFLTFLENKHPKIKSADEVTTEVIRDYVYYMSKEKKLWNDHTKSILPI